MKIKSIFLHFLLFISTFFSQLHADPLDDEEIVKVFKVENSQFSLTPAKPLHSSNPKYSYESKEMITYYEDIKAVGVKPQWDQDIPYRLLTLYINIPEAEAVGTSHIGFIELREFFYHRDLIDNTSSFVILKNFKINENYQKKGLGKATLSCFLKILDELDSSRISHNVYAYLGNHHPGVYKMYLENGFNYFYNAQTMKIFDVRKNHNPCFLEGIKTENSSAFSKEDVPVSCLIRREPVKRFYDPYSFEEQAL